MSDIGLRVTSPAPREAWLDVVEASDDALAFHTPAWTETMTAFGGYVDVSRLYETRSGRRAVLPLIRRARMPGRLAIDESLPFGWGFGGLVSAGGLSADELRGVWDDLRGRHVLRTSLRQNPLADPAAVDGSSAGLVTVPRLAHVLDLAGGFDEVWNKRFRGTARTAVRKAEKAGVEVEAGSSQELVSSFYELYLESIDRRTAQERLVAIAGWRSRRREPRRKFELVAAQLRDACRIFVARHDGRPAAAIIVLFQGRNASYWRGAMSKDIAAPTRANYLLHSLAIQEACAAGCRYYHMGETGGAASLSQFKTRFGATAVDYPEYRLESAALISALRMLGPLARLRRG